MEKYLIRKSTNVNTTTQGLATTNSSNGSRNASRPAPIHNSVVPKLIDLNKLPRDPAKRKRMADYHPNQRDEIRRKYLIWGPNQTCSLKFPYREIGKKKKRRRRFNPDWFDEYANWLEYSEKEHKAYCLCYYLFRDNIKDSHHGHDAFVVEVLNCWNKPDIFVTHIGDHNSFHNRALKDCDDLLKQDQSIPASLHRQIQIEKNEHLICLNAAFDVCRYLLHQGQSFRVHDESKDSENKGNYRELMDYTIKQNDVVAKAFKSPPNNNQVSNNSERYYRVLCKRSVGYVMEGIGNGVFSLLVDECRDVSNKLEQMAVVLRYVYKCALVQEKFVGAVHVEEATASSLKYWIDSLVSQLGLTLKQVRGQGYDKASNMSGEFNGLQAKNMSQKNSAHYIHCFAHKLNLVVVAIAKKIFDVGDFFGMVSVLLNVMGASCKRKDQLREHHQEEVRKAIGCGEIATGTGLNQELSLQRLGDTPWNSHYKTLLGLSKLFSSVIKVLEYVVKDGTDTEKRCQAKGLLKYFQTFDSAIFLTYDGDDIDFNKWVVKNLTGKE